MTQPTAKLSIVIALYPDVTHLDFTGPHQVLSRARNAEVTVASMGGRDIASEGLVFTDLADLAKVRHCDLLLVPGGMGAVEAMLDVAFLREIRRLGAGATYLTSVCTGSLILAAAGFLTGKRAATHWAWRELLEPFGVQVATDRVVRDGNIITGGGVTAGLDFAFTVLAELCGDDYAQAVQLGLEYAPSPPSTRASAPPSPAVGWPQRKPRGACSQPEQQQARGRGRGPWSQGSAGAFAVAFAAQNFTSRTQLPRSCFS